MLSFDKLNLIVSIIGVLKAGTVFVPIDPLYPIQRIRKNKEEILSSISIVNWIEKYKDSIPDLKMPLDFHRPWMQSLKEIACFLTLTSIFWMP